MSFALLAALIGCEKFPPSGYNGDLNGDEDVEPASPIADITWGEDALTLEIRGGTGYDFQFGFLQSGDCEENDTVRCWTGESCVGYGYVNGSGVVVREPDQADCHPAGSAGVTLDYSPTGVAGILDGTTQVVFGQNTAFEDNSYETSVTYYLEDTVSGKCWVWGVDPSQYDGLTTATCTIPSDAD